MIDRMTITPEQRTEMREAGRAAYAEWLADPPGDFKRAALERQRAVNKLRYKYDPRRLMRGRPNAPLQPCSCPRVGGLWLQGENGPEVVWRECPDWRTTRFDWASGHTNWIHRVAAKEFLMGRQLYLRPRAASHDDWLSVTPSDPEPQDPRAVLEQLGLASDPESFARKVLQAARSINSDATRLPVQRQERKAIEWARQALAEAGERPGDHLS